jgi:hypothetical protein
MNEAFVLKPTPDGGMSLHLNLARTSFVVAVTPAEMADIKKRVEAWHAQAHAKSPAAVSGDSVPYARREVVGMLMRRMAEVTPPGLMGAVAKAAIKKRVVTGTKKPAVTAVRKPGVAAPAKAPAKIDPAKIRALDSAFKLLVGRRARFIAANRTKTVNPKAAPTAAETTAARSWAIAYLGKAGFPTDPRPNPANPFWRQTAQAIASKAAATLNRATKEGAPAKIAGPKPFRLERNKLKAVENALKIVGLRRAKFLAWQRKPSSPVTSGDVKVGTLWAREFFQKNGIPATTAPHQFWDQPLPIIQTKIGSVVKLAEAQGAPAKPPTPVKPVVVKMDPKKIAVIRTGLRALAGRRSRYLAKQRNDKYTSPKDIAEGKKFAREVFTKAQIPVTYPVPGRKGLVTIAGWIGADPLAPTAINKPDPVTAFWAQDPSVIKQKVDDALKSAEKDAPATLPPPVPVVMPPAPTAPPDGVPSPITMEPGGGGGAPGDAPEGTPADVAPGDVPQGDPAPGVEDAIGPSPGDMSQPEEPPPEMPGELATADDPAGEQYPAGDVPYTDPGAAPEDVPGTLDLPTDEAPADLPPDQYPGDFEQTEEQPPLEEVPETEVSPDEFMPTDEAVDIAEDSTQGEGHMYGAFEIGAHRHRHGKKIPKAKYEAMVKKCALVIAAKRAKTQPTPADYAAAKIHVDRKLKARGMTVAGDNILGVSDIMGAAYIIGAAERGHPAAKMAIKKSVIAAKKGSPKAHKFVRAMTAVAQGKQRSAEKKKGGLFSRYFRAVNSLSKR